MPLCLRPLEHFLRNIGSVVLLDRYAAGSAEKRCTPSKNELETVVELGHCADGRARRFDAVCLVDGDRRRYAVDFVDLRTVAALQKLAGVGTEGFNVASLSFCVECVKGKRTFPGAGRTGNDGHRAGMDVEIQIAQVVLTCATDANGTDVGSVEGVLHNVEILSGRTGRVAKDR